MAERLAPEHAQLRVSSRPERPRGRTRRWARRLIAVVGSLVVVAAAGLVTLHFIAIHRSAHEVRATALIPPELPASVLVVLARPGQELAMAGTLAELDEAGAQVSILSLNRGEAQPPELESAADRIADVRADELANAGDLLGAERVTTAEYGDGELMVAEPAEVTATITEAIEEAAPSAVLTVSDETGRDNDSQAVASYVLAAAQAGDSGVARVWTVTRGERELSWGAVLSDSMAGREVPEPEIAVRFDSEAATKGEVLLAHGTQSPDLVQATYPLAHRIPAWAYFRFWDREYFALAWGQPLE